MRSPRAVEWVFGLVSLLLGLSMLAALPVIQFLSLGYFLESSARVARSGRLRDGLVGVRKAARVGGVTAGIWLSLVPAWLAGSYCRSAELIDPGGRIARNWRIALVAVTVVSLLHIGVSCARGGRLRHFLWPLWHPFWLVRRVRDRGAVRRGSRWAAGVRGEPADTVLFPARAGRLPGYARVARGARDHDRRHRPAHRVVAAIGALLLAVIVPFLPFLQVRYAVEGRVSALFSRRAIRDRFRRAPWAFAFSLLVLLVAAIPLYLLKLEMIPREAAWLPSLVFVIFLAPARLLTGLGLCALRTPRSPASLDLSRPGPARDRTGRRALRPRRLPRPVHVLGRCRQPLRTARLLAAGPVLQHVNGTGRNRSSALGCGKAGDRAIGAGFTRRPVSSERRRPRPRPSRTEYCWTTRDHSGALS